LPVATYVDYCNKTKIDTDPAMGRMFCSSSWRRDWRTVESWQFGSRCRPLIRPSPVWPLTSLMGCVYRLACTAAVKRKRPLPQCWWWSDT